MGHYTQPVQDDMKLVWDSVLYLFTPCLVIDHIVIKGDKAV